MQSLSVTHVDTVIVPVPVLVVLPVTVSVLLVTSAAPEFFTLSLHDALPILIPLLVIVPELLMPPVPVSLSVPALSVIVPALLIAALPVSVSVGLADV